MGTGGTSSLWSSGLTCRSVASFFTNQPTQFVESFHQTFAWIRNQLWIAHHLEDGFCSLDLSTQAFARGCQGYRVKPHEQLVLVSLTHYCASTPNLSTSWSRTTLQGAQGPGKTHLETSFPLRCFQRLSLPHLATRQCHWRDNRYTRGVSTPVLSY